MKSGSTKYEEWFVLTYLIKRIILQWNKMVIFSEELAQGICSRLKMIGNKPEYTFCAYTINRINSD